MMSIKPPLWLRFVLFAGVLALAIGASLFGHRYHTRPVTLTVAVGSIDGEAAKAMSTIASRLISTKAAVRLKIEGHADARAEMEPGHLAHLPLCAEMMLRKSTSFANGRGC